MFLQLLKNRAAAVAGLLMSSGLAMADGAATGPDTSVITAAGVTVAAIGVAVFGVKVAIKTFKWAIAAL